jgi:hypothetical protein
MKKSRKKASQKLYEIADSQQGFFTRQQAVAAGFAGNTHPYHVHAKNWIREYRGVYRLVQFPQPPNPHLMLWSLWSRNRRGIIEGIYSHETALSLHNISDANPVKLNMTVPKHFRRSSPIPRILILHRADLPTDDIAGIHGVKVTKPLATIITLLGEGRVSKDILIQALRDGLRLGVITQAAINGLSLSKVIQKEFDEVLSQARRR